MLVTRISPRIAVPMVVLAIAAGLRLWGLGAPPSLYWDEQYYVFDAEVYLGGGIGQPIPGAPPVKIADEGTWMHPPLGKWVMALLGVGPMGLRSIGWRLPSALFGIVGVGLLYLLALSLWRSVWWAGMASLLLALDGLHIVQSRIAMLDIFLTTFITAGMLFVVLDRRRMEAPAPSQRWPRIEHVFGSPYRLWAGIFLGAAVATKWSGAFALAFAAILSLWWTGAEARRGGRSMTSIALTSIASFAIVPLLVYLMSYGAFFYQHGPAVRDFVTLQIRMLQFHEHHLSVKPTNSAPWTWPLLLHPIRYYSVATGTSVTRIEALGNPVLWWGFLALLPIALVRIVRQRHWQDALTFGGYAAMFLPWLFIARTQYFFYMLPAVPFMCLCIVSTIRSMPKTAAPTAGIVFVCLAVAASIAFVPEWTGWLVPAVWVDRLDWLARW